MFRFFSHFFLPLSFSLHVYLLPLLFFLYSSLALLCLYSSFYFPLSFFSLPHALHINISSPFFFHFLFLFSPFLSSPFLPHPIYLLLPFISPHLFYPPHFLSFLPRSLTHTPCPSLLRQLCQVCKEREENTCWVLITGVQVGRKHPRLLLPGY